MIVTIEEVRQFIATDMEDQALEAMLQALELSVQGYTNNDFKRILDENGGQYPADVKMGVISLLRWELSHRDKVGVASESISRHSVTYFDMTGDNSTMGFPKALMGFLAPYMRARFGRGVGK
jgi:hypothetical protein